MKIRLFCLTLALSFVCAAAQGSTLDDIGVTALRAVTTTLNGAGIRVAQPEASGTGLTNFEVNPSLVGLPGSRFTFISAAGTDTNYPNSVGTYSVHAKDVGAYFYGIPGGVATNVAHVDNYDTDFFITNYVFNLTPIPDAAIVNQSFTWGVLAVVDQQEVDSAYDDYSETIGTLFVSAACNATLSLKVCAPGTAYNCLSVGAYGGDSSIGPTLDNGRCKPDITAPAGATSFSTPQVAGATAVLMQAALRGDGGDHSNAAADMRTLKALLLNGAVKPTGWTNGSATPLDARHGAGVLNVLNAYAQLAGQQHGWIATNLVTVGAAHPPLGSLGTVPVLNGWDFNTNVSRSAPGRDGINHYYFEVTNSGAAKFIATATLVWNRQQNESDINNLNLFLYDCATSNLVACSTSRVDNVEHIYVTNLPPGRYDLQVWKAGGAGIVSGSEAYALAFAFVPPPELAIAGGGAPTLSWPVYPAGFRVETATNLTAPAWLTSGLALPTVTNSRHSLILNATNAHRFFRLRAPSF